MMMMFAAVAVVVVMTGVGMVMIMSTMRMIMVVAAVRVIVMAVVMIMGVVMRMIVAAVGMGVGIRMVMIVSAMSVVVIVTMRTVHIEFHAFDVGFGGAADVQMPVLIERQFTQLGFQFPRVHAEVDHGAEKHVAADAAEDVEVESGHGRDEGWVADEIDRKPLGVVC
jgi:hypothetical protein